MHRASLATAIVVVAVSWMPAAKDELTKSHQTKLNGHTFTLPAGFDTHTWHRFSSVTGETVRQGADEHRRGHEGATR